jgi:hypothetical protein
MYFDIKNYLKNTHNHAAKHTINKRFCPGSFDVASKWHYQVIEKWSIIEEKNKTVPLEPRHA